jgi:hypothetical protein
MNNQMLNMMMNQIMNKNPQARELYEQLKSKTPDELKEYAQNVAKGKGIDLNSFLGQYGIRC